MTSYLSPRRDWMRHWLPLWLLSLCLMAGTRAFATPVTINVPADYTTLQDAIDAASSSGSTILVADGTYSGPGNVDLDSRGKSFTLQSVNGPSHTIIDCGGSSSVNHNCFDLYQGETMTLKGFTIENGYSIQYGGAIYADNTATLTLTNCIFENNVVIDDTNIGSGAYGGALFTGGTATITNCAFRGNSAQVSIAGGNASYGGAVVNSGRATVTNCTFTNNAALWTAGGTQYGYGGGFSNISGNASLVNCIVYGNASATAGVEETNNNGGTLTFTSCDIHSSVSGTGNIDSDPLFADVTTGDLHLQSGSPCLAAGTTSGAPTNDLDGNARPVTPSIGAYEAAPHVAATIHVPADYPTIQAAITAAVSGDTIEISSGTFSGPGNVDIDTNGKNLTIRSALGPDLTIIDCGGSASALHRGFYFHSSETVTLEGLTIKNGYQDLIGAAVSADAGVTLTLTHCAFDNNFLTSSFTGPGAGGFVYGGGVYSAGTATLTNCTFTGNTATSAGGAASYGGGFYSSGTATVINCTFTGNTAASAGGGSGFGGGIYNRGNTTVINCILYGDSGDSGLEEYSSLGSGIHLSSCDVQGGAFGTGNIDTDPLFVDAPNGDLHLQPGSPCFAAGTASGAPAADKDGVLRPATPSIGAYEGAPAVVQPTLQSLTLTPDPLSLTIGSTQQMTLIATFSDASLQDVTAQATWTSNVPGVLSVDANGLTTANHVGMALFSAAFGGQTVSLTASVTDPNAATNYWALWNRPGGEFSLWSVALGGGITPYDFDADAGMTSQAIAATPDGHIHVLLTAADGTTRFRDADPTTLGRDHNVSSIADYGPFPGWTANTLAAGNDGMTHVLWTRTDNMISLWNLLPNGSYTHAEYGPFAGWTARFLSVAPDNTVRVLWTNTSGEISFWVMDSTGSYQHQEFGAYPGWSPSALATGPDGTSHITWNHAGDDMVSLWWINDAGQFIFADYGPYSGWNAEQATVGADGTLHLGWAQTGGMASLWDIPVGTSSSFTHAEYGPYGDWHLQGLTAAP